MLIVVVGLWVNYPFGTVFTQERPQSTKRGGLWEFPGGKVEDGETMREALKREWHEELGLHIEVGGFIDEVVISFPDAGNVLLPLFEVTVDSQTLIAREGQKVRWSDPEEIEGLSCVPTMLHYLPAVRRLLA
jgi:mutator protein MutT